MNSPRLLAVSVLVAVIRGHSLSEKLDEVLLALPDTRDRAFVQMLSYGVCRSFHRLQALLTHLLAKPLKAKDNDIYALLLMGLYQLLEMRVPDYAAIAETVEVAALLKKPWAKGLVNAVLREYQRHPQPYQQAVAADPEAIYSHPGWWIEKLQRDWPSQWQAILAANNMHPPLTLRVNLLQSTREHYLAELAQQNLLADTLAETAAGIVLAEAVPVESLPGFAQGEVSVQDGAAQLAVSLLDLQPGQRVLDACAAPGGKAAHILEKQPAIKELIAVDKGAQRLQAVQENFTRLRVQTPYQCLAEDAGQIAKWWQGELFDRILLDAPCSGSGVVRRHPDIKLLRRASDVVALAKEQQRLLQALWPFLAPGGCLLYATCSIFPEENTQVIQTFLAQHPEAREEKIQTDWGVACTVGKQILPGVHEMDGFYYACLRK